MALKNPSEYALSPFCFSAGCSSCLLNGHVAAPQMSCSEDMSQLVQDIAVSHSELQDGSTACPEPLVMDLRSYMYVAVLGNRAKGGSCECTGEPYSYTGPLDKNAITPSHKQTLM